MSQRGRQNDYRPQVRLAPEVVERYVATLPDEHRAEGRRLLQDGDLDAFRALQRRGQSDGR